MTAELTPQNVRKAERLAVLSSCFGFPGEVVLTDSAIIILFAGALGAGDMLSLLTTSFLPFLNGLCMIPTAYLVMRHGHRAVMLRVLTLSSLMYFLAAASPWFGAAGIAVMLTAVLLFALGVTGFVAGWYPMLDTFLTRDSRTPFFSRMRFCHQLTSVLFLMTAGALLGAQPPLWKMQLVIFAAALMFCGRALCVARIPEFPARAPEKFGFFDGLRRAIGNKGLTGFSLYLFMLNISTFGTVPLTMLYLKKGLHAPDNIVVFLSAAALTGMLLGYLGIGRTVKLLGGTGRAFVTFHLLCFILNTSLFFLDRGGIAAWCFAGAVLLMFSFLLAGNSILASSEMMELATPGNKVMAMAFSGTFSYGATGLARVVPSLLLGSGLLASSWEFHGLVISRWRSLYLLGSCAILLSAVFLFLVPAVFPDNTNSRSVK